MFARQSYNVFAKKQVNYSLLRFFSNQISKPTYRLNVLYDAECPICLKEIEFLKATYKISYDIGG